MEDFGNDRYDKIINNFDVKQLLVNAIDSLLAIQNFDKPLKTNGFKQYNYSTFKEDIIEFVDFYLPILKTSSDKIEEFLISSDVGIDAASEIRNILAQEKIDPSSDLIGEINKVLKRYIVSTMGNFEKKDFFKNNNNLNVILVAGVNGSGKTTTIGKIAKIFKENNNKVVLSASDTFRAAAIEQLENWANKIGVDLVKSNQGSDPASVAYKAMSFAKENNFNQLIIDTAGRLQNKKNLMEEYKKIANVVKKIDNNAPNEVILVLDATSGQNILSQVDEFNKIIPITGLVMTKLDGTAKGLSLIHI